MTRKHEDVDVFIPHAHEFPAESCSSALERALADAGKSLTPKFAATVAGARMLARRMDQLAQDPDSKDGVTAPTFLKYLQALGLTMVLKRPKGRPSKPKPEEKTDLQRFAERFGVKG